MKKHETRIDFRLKYLHVTERKAGTRGWAVAIRLCPFSAGLQSAITVRHPGRARCSHGVSGIFVSFGRRTDETRATCPGTNGGEMTKKTRAHRNGSPLSPVQYGVNITRDYVRNAEVFFLSNMFFLPLVVRVVPV